jgi:hypothetical protein
MQPGDVDVVRLQAAQRGFRLLQQRLPAGPAAVWIALEPIAEELGANDGAIATRI